MRVSAIFITLLAMIIFLGCDTTDINVHPTPEPDPVPEDMEFKLEIKHVGMYDVEVAITPPNDTITYCCGVVPNHMVKGDEEDYTLAMLALTDLQPNVFRGEGLYRSVGYLPASKQTFICFYDPVSCDQFVTPTTEAITLEFNTLSAPDVENSITSIELCGPYQREDILSLDPTISEVAASSEGMWYFYRITTANDNIMQIYSYPTYQLGMLDQYDRLFALLMQNGGGVVKNIINHPWDNSSIVVYAMVQDMEGVMSPIAESISLKNDMECRDAQEFVEFYYQCQ